MYGEIGEISNESWGHSSELRSTAKVGLGELLPDVARWSAKHRALFIFICLHNTYLPSNRKALPHLQTLKAQ